MCQQTHDRVSCSIPVALGFIILGVVACWFPILSMAEGSLPPLNEYCAKGSYTCDRDPGKGLRRIYSGSRQDGNKDIVTDFASVYQASEVRALVCTVRGYTADDTVTLAGSKLAIKIDGLLKFLKPILPSTTVESVKDYLDLVADTEEAKKTRARATEEHAKLCVQFGGITPKAVPVGPPQSSDPDGADPAPGKKAAAVETPKDVTTGKTTTEQRTLDSALAGVQQRYGEFKKRLASSDDANAYKTTYNKILQLQRKLVCGIFDEQLDDVTDREQRILLISCNMLVFAAQLYPHVNDVYEAQMMSDTIAAEDDTEFGKYRNDLVNAKNTAEKLGFGELALAAKNTLKSIEAQRAENFGAQGGTGDWWLLLYGLVFLLVSAGLFFLLHDYLNRSRKSPRWKPQGAASEVPKSFGKLLRSIPATVTAKPRKPQPITTRETDIDAIDSIDQLTAQLFDLTQEVSTTDQAPPVRSPSVEQASDQALRVFDALAPAVHSLRDDLDKTNQALRKRIGEYDALKGREKEAVRRAEKTEEGLTAIQQDVAKLKEQLEVTAREYHKVSRMFEQARSDWASCLPEFAQVLPDNEYEVSSPARFLFVNRVTGHKERVDDLVRSLVELEQDLGSTTTDEGNIDERLYEVGKVLFELGERAGMSMDKQIGIANDWVKMFHAWDAFDHRVQFEVPEVGYNFDDATMTAERAPRSVEKVYNWGLLKNDEMGRRVIRKARVA